MYMPSIETPQLNTFQTRGLRIRRGMGEDFNEALDHIQGYKYKYRKKMTYPDKLTPQKRVRCYAGINWYDSRC